MNINEQPLSVKAIEKEKLLLNEAILFHTKRVKQYGFSFLLFFIAFFAMFVLYDDKNHHGIGLFLPIMVLPTIAFCLYINIHKNNSISIKNLFLSILFLYIVIAICLFFNNFFLNSPFIRSAHLIVSFLTNASMVIFFNNAVLGIDKEKEFKAYHYSEKAHCLELVKWKEHDPIARYIEKVIEVGRPSITNGEYLMLEKTWNKYQESIQKSIQEEKINEACKKVYLEPLLKS